MKKKFINVSLGSFLAFVAMGVIISACSDETVKPETIIDAQGNARQAELDAIRAIKRDSLNFLLAFDSAQYAQEVDSLRRIDSLSRAEDSVALVTGGGYLTYNVQVLNMSTSAGAATRVSDDAGVDGAVVTVSMFGVTQSATTSAAGIATFPSMVQGNVSGNVTVADHTDATWVAELDVDDEFLFIVSPGAVSQVVISDGSGGGETTVIGAEDEFPANNEDLDESGFLVLPNGEVVTDPGQPLSLSTAIPVFATTSNMGNITGYVTVQTDLTDSDKEFAPAGTSVQGYIDVEQLVDQNWFEDIFEEDEGDHTQSAYIQYISYEDALYSTTVDTTGKYSLMVPAAIQGLPIVLKCPNFRADQTYWSGSTVVTADKVFGFEIEPDPITSSQLLYTIGRADGFDNTALTIVDDGSGSMFGINLLKMGSGYNCDTIPLTFAAGSGSAAGYALNDGTGMITSIVLTDSGTGVTAGGNITISEFSSQATAHIGMDNFIIPVDNGVVAVIIDESGKGYDSATLSGGPFVTFTDLVAGTDNLDGTRAEGTAMLNAQHGVEMINVTVKGGGYANAPTATVTCGDATDFDVTVDVLDPATKAFATVYMSEDTVLGTVGASMVVPIALTVDSITIRSAVPGTNVQGDGYTEIPVIDFTQLATEIDFGLADDVDMTGGDPGDVVAAATAALGVGGFLGVQTLIDSITVTAGGTYHNNGDGFDNGDGLVTPLLVHSFTICDGCVDNNAQGPAVVSGQILGITVDDGGDLFCATPLLDTMSTSLGAVGTPTTKIQLAGLGMALGGSQVANLSEVIDTVFAVGGYPAGAGYTTADAAAIEALIEGGIVTTNLGDGAAGTAIIEGVQIVGIGIDSKGADYLCDPTVVFSPPSMNMAGVAQAATGTPKMFNGQVIGVTITDPGFGYQALDFNGLSGPGDPVDATVTFPAGTGFLAEAYESGFGIKSIQITAAPNNSAGYCDPSDISISAPKGSGAAADAIIMDGMLLGFTVSSAGSGYMTTTAGAGDIWVDVLGDGPGESTNTGAFNAFGATLSANVSGGLITSVDVVQKGGSHFDPACPPWLSIELYDETDYDSAALKLADLVVSIDALGEIDSVAVTYGGENYPNQNYPTSAESAWVGGEIVEFDKAVITMPNMDRHVDFYLGTGASTSNDKTSGE